jgi:glycosyltransferase involved in cell wall biosynthesis
MPRLSVLLPVYNCRRYLAAAIASIRAQAFADFECIVVDDGSTDGSAAIIDRASAVDPRLRVVRRPNTGIVGALNNGLALATAEFIARMDGDDVAEPGRFAAQLAFLEDHPEVVALGCAARTIDSRGAILDLIRPPLAHEAIVDQLLLGNGAALIHPAVILRRTALVAAGPYAAEFCKAEDLDLFLRLARFGRLANLAEPLLRYRLHLQSTNFSQRTRQKELVLRILARERTARGLSPLTLADLAGPADQSHAALHRNWACTACRHGRASTALRHALLALAAEPLAHASWSVLRYTLGRPLGRRPVQP